VLTVPALCQTRKPVSPVAAWYFLIFVPKKFALRANFLGTKIVYSALPEADRAVHPDEHLIWNQPRNACNITLYLTVTIHGRLTS